MYFMKRKRYEKSLTLTAAFHVIFLSTVSRFVTQAVVTGYQLWRSVTARSLNCKNHLPATLISESRSKSPQCRAVWSNLWTVRPSLMSVMKLPIICARSALHEFGPLILAVSRRSHFTSASNWELPLLCSLSLACTERMRAHLHLYPAGFYYSSSVWERDHTKVERVISYVSTSAENGPAMAGPAGPVSALMQYLGGSLRLAPIVMGGCCGGRT